MKKNDTDTKRKKPLWITPDMHTEIKTAASAEKLSIKEFVGMMYALYLQQSAHQ